MDGMRQILNLLLCLRRDIFSSELLLLDDGGKTTDKAKNFFVRHGSIFRALNANGSYTISVTGFESREEVMFRVS